MAEGQEGQTVQQIAQQRPGLREKLERFAKRIETGQQELGTSRNPQPDTPNTPEQPTSGDR